MRTRRAFLAAAIATAVILFAVPPAALAQTAGSLPAATVLVNGARLNADAYIISGRTLVPLRAIFEALGATVAWDNATKTVTATRGGIVIQLTISRAEALVNGRSVALSVPAMIIDSRTFVPLRFVSEALGAEVGYDAPTRTVTVKTAGGQAATGGGGTGSGTVAGGLAGLFTAPPNPLRVSVRPDAGRAARAEVPPEGATLRATAADGTRFTLTLPPGAVSSAETITMTPVTAVDGLPLSRGLVGAVHLGPEGMWLGQPATLTIELPGGVNAAKLTGFGYRGSGEEFYLYPVQAGSSAITFRLRHFSGYGAGLGTDADRAAQQQRTPTAAADRAAQQLSELTRTGDGAAAGSLLTQWYEQGVRPGLSGAGTDPAQLAAAAQDFFAWADEMEALGLGEELGNLYAQGLELLGQAMAALARDLYQNCEGETDFDRLVATARLVRFISFMSPAGGSLLDSDVIGKLRTCLSFELEFDSRMEGSGFDEDTAYAASLHVRAVVPFDLLSDPAAGGSGPLEYPTAVYQVQGECGLSTTPQGSRFQIVRTDLRLNSFRPGEPPDAPLRELSMVINPGRPQEIITMACPSNPPFTFTSALWSGFFYHLHRDEAGSGTYIIREWGPGGGAVVARKQYLRTGSVPAGDLSWIVSESTVLTLRHKPR